MAPDRLLGQGREPGALDAARGAGEAALDHLVAQADRLEDLRSLVALERRDPHLAHHLEHALGDTLAVVRDHRGVVGVLGRESSQPALAAEAREREVGVDGVGAVAHQQTVVMDLARLRGLEHQRDARALDLADQVVVHRAAGEQRADRHPVGPHRAIRQHRDLVAVGDRLLGFGADARDRPLHPGLAFGRAAR